MEQRISQFLQNYVAEVYFPNIRVTDIVEILFLAFLIYQLMIWIKNTKAWMLLKGIGVLAVVIFAAAIFQMHTILSMVSSLNLKRSLDVSNGTTDVRNFFSPSFSNALRSSG